jgi:mitogen-activated protein kinase 7
MCLTVVVDLWSVGCILAELLGGRPFFKGRDYVDQLNQILHYLGTPNEETLSRIGSQRVCFSYFTILTFQAQDYVRNLPFMPKIPFNRVFPAANPQGIKLHVTTLIVALDLLERLLAFDPAQRITVEEALEHPYLAIWHDPTDEPDAPSQFEFDFEHVNDMAQMKRIFPTSAYEHN